MTLDNLPVPYPDCGIILAAGGSSSRFGKTNKLLAMLGDRPVFIHSLSIAVSLVPKGAVVVAAPEETIDVFETLANKYLPDSGVRFVSGGNTRMASVCNALCAFELEATKMISIHDAARPYVTHELFARTFDACRIHSGAVVCRKICDTVKLSDEFNSIIGTLDRSALWSAETPQTFMLDLLLDAYGLAISAGQEFTDDSGVIEEFGTIRPAIVENRNFNGKITFAEDLLKR